MNIKLTLLLTYLLFINSNPADADAVLKFYRQVGEKILRPDVTKSTHPIVTKNYLKPGKFIEGTVPTEPTTMDSILDSTVKQNLDKEFSHKFSGKKYLKKVTTEMMNQKIFLSEEEKKIITEETMRDILLRQSKHRTKEYIAVKVASPINQGTLPTSLDSEKEIPYAKTFAEIRNFLGNPKEVLKRLRELDREVLILKKAHPLIDRELHLQEVLARWERYFNFKPAVVLEPKILTAAEWYQMLKDGATFYDLYWEPRWYEPHGAETHRLQIHALVREILDNPKRFGLSDPKDFVKVYQELGNEESMKNYQWPKKLSDKEKGCWYQLLDTEEINFTGPVLTRWITKVMEGLKDAK